MYNIIIQRCLPHYRSEVFKELAKRCQSLKFAFGNKAYPANLKLVKPESVCGELKRRSIFISNIILPFGFYFQKGVVRMAAFSRYDSIMLEGDVHNLSTLFSALFGRLRGKRVVFWTHGFLSPNGGFKAWVKTRFFKLATHFAVYGQRGKQICIEKGINPERIAVVNNSLPCIRAGNAEYSAPLDEIRKFKASVFSQPQHPVIVWIGRLLEINRLECLLVSACELRRRNCPINVLIIGDGEAASSLSSLAEELGLNDNVHFAGACYDESKIGLMLSSSDLFVAPARTGLSCIHALSYGVPVLTSDNFDKQCPEHEAVLPGKTGFFFDHTEEGALVDAIKESLDKFSNTETRDLCRKTAYEMFSVERHAERLLNAMMGKGK